MVWSRLSRRSTVGLTILLVLVATAVPVIASLVLASRQAHSAQQRSATRYASAVLKRSEMITQQVWNAFTKMAELPHVEDCGPAVISQLQAIDAVSSYLQMVGTVKNDAIVCSSYGLQNPPLLLGDVDYVSAVGARVRNNVRFPFAPDESFIVSENGRFAAVVHKALPVDATVAEPGVSLAIVAASQSRALATRGHIDPRWIPERNLLAPGEQRTLTIGGTAVTQIRSKVYDLLAIAALGNENYVSEVTGLALVMVPFGLIVGGLMSWLLLRILRAQRTLPAAIRAGLRNREFFIELQPIVRLSDRAWVGAEVLLRWRRPNGELVRPDLFIGAAEDAGMIRQVTSRVLELVAPALHAIALRDEEFFLSLNMAAQDLYDDGMAGQLTELLAQTQSRASHVRIEITERALLDVKRAENQLASIRALGIHISIDDFGTGYSGLSDLISLKVDSLKIDKTFIDTIGGEAATSQVAAHIVEMAHALSLQITAEGVEQPQQADILSNWGVQYAQGWLFSKALPIDVFLLLLEKRRQKKQQGHLTARTLSVIPRIPSSGHGTSPR